MPLSEITVYPAGCKDDESLEFENIDFLSFINGETYGKPPLITGDEEGSTARAIAREGQIVLFVNPANVAAVEVHK